MLKGSVYLIACGALAHELVQLKTLNNWEHLTIQCLPAELHNRPEKIPAAIEAKILENQDKFDRILIGYADCGTGGLLDLLIEKYDVSRIPGAHCYEFFAGSKVFDELVEQEIGSLYLTDYLARNFMRLIVKGMGIEKYPELKEMLFGNYRKIVYLAQSNKPEFEQAAREAADYLDLEFEKQVTGLKPIESVLRPMV